MTTRLAHAGTKPPQLVAAALPPAVPRRHGYIHLQFPTTFDVQFIC
jgi:hypothetical protein